jgi:hypothetical protein
MNFFAVTLLGLFAFTAVHGAEVKSNMDNFYVNLNDLQPFLVNKSKFIDEKSRMPVQGILNAMSDNVKNLKLKKMSQTDDMRFRVQLLSEGLEEAAKTYKDGFRDYAFWVTKSSLYNCYSCHTERGLPETKFKFSFSTETTKFEKADFLFMVRNYSDSTKIFKDLVAGYPKNKSTLDELMIAVKKTVYFQMRVQRDDDVLLATINQFLKNKDLPIFMIRDMSQWKKYLEIKKYRILPENELLKSVKMLNEFISERDQIAAHFGEGQERFIVDQETLYFLHKNLLENLDRELKNQIFYWISKIQREYRESMFDNSAEIYLTECVQLTSEYATAKKCLDEYTEQKLQTFDTRQVTELPNLIRKQIDDLTAKTNSLNKKKK